MEISITKTGAVTGKSGGPLSTEAIQKAIDKVASAGGGKVLIPAGRFMTGALRLLDGVELHLLPGAVLAGSPNLEDYPVVTGPGYKHELGPEKTSHALLFAVGSRDIAITGTGVIEMPGLAFYDSPDSPGKLQKPNRPRPRMVMLYQCHGVRLEGVHLRDCPCWTVWLMHCEQVRIHGVRISGDHRMRNNDGIDLDSCRRVTVSDCDFDTEDDCLVIRAIQRLYEQEAVCEDVVVSNCILRSRCQGIRIGCPNDGTIRNILFSNIVIHSANHGITIDNPHRYLRSGPSGNLDLDGVLFQNIVINCPNFPLLLRVEEGIRLRRLSGIQFQNLRVTSSRPLLVQGCPETSIKRISFSQVEILQLDPAQPPLLCSHVEDLQIQGLTVRQA